MRKQKNDRNILIYRKWSLPLLNIRYGLEKADILPLLTFTMNKSTILKSINIVYELAKRVELLDEVIRDKLTLLKRDLMTI